MRARKESGVIIMCKMNIVINQLVLGNRELGWECWNGKELVEYTSKQLKDIIKAGKQKVCGLKIGQHGELELDKDGFFTTNMMVHSHIGSWKAMEQEGMTNVLYVCIGSHEESGKVVYDCISSRFEQAEVSESDMRAYLRIGIISGGAKMENDNIVLASTELEKAPVKVQVKEEVKEETPVKKEVKEEVKVETPVKKEVQVKEETAVETKGKVEIKKGK